MKTVKLFLRTKMIQGGAWEQRFTGFKANRGIIHLLRKQNFPKN